MDALRAIPSWRQQEESLGILLALREKTIGYVFAQTRAESDDIIRYAQDAATASYYTDELAARASFDYPPFSTFIHLTWKKDSRDSLTKEITARLASFDITIYAPPAAEERIGYGLIRIRSNEWPQDTLVDALRSLSPSVRIIINPDRII
jgi:primosomal protein N'